MCVLSKKLAPDYSLVPCPDNPVHEAQEVPRQHAIAFRSGKALTDYPRGHLRPLRQDIKCQIRRMNRQKVQEAAQQAATGLSDLRETIGGSVQDLGWLLRIAQGRQP